MYTGEGKGGPDPLREESRLSDINSSFLYIYIPKTHKQPTPLFMSPRGYTYNTYSILMDTQGMSLPGQSMGEIKQHKPMEVTYIPMIEPKLKQELKELINEVLDERYE